MLNVKYNKLREGKKSKRSFKVAKKVSDKTMEDINSATKKRSKIDAFKVPMK